MNRFGDICVWGTILCFMFFCVMVRPSVLMADEANISPLRQSEDVENVENDLTKLKDEEVDSKEQQDDKEAISTKQKSEAKRSKKTSGEKDHNKKVLKDPPLKKQEKDAEPSFLDNVFGKKKLEKKDRFDIDYSPSAKKGDGKTPFYKHWIFWTVIGAVVVTGTVLGLKYGVDKSDSMSFDIERR